MRRATVAPVRLRRRLPIDFVTFVWACFMRSWLVFPDGFRNNIDQVLVT